MDFGAFPPEINSARIYAGPGSAPMLTAAAAWAGLAAELRSAATGYQSEVTGLTSEGWTGPAATTMAAAAAPYIGWMETTAVQAEQTATQAQAAAAAFEEAFAMTVPPPVVAANRAQLATLVATNVLGQNTAAIAATEAHYGQMWAQDAAAMYGYAANSAAATKLTPFVAPAQTTNPAGQANQAAAVSQANASTAGSSAQSALSQAVSTTPNMLQGLASPLQSTPANPILGDIGSALGLQPGDVSNALSNLASSSFSPMGVAGMTQVGADAAVIHSVANGGVVGPYGGVIPGWGEGLLSPGGIGPELLTPGAGISAVTPGGMGMMGLAGQVSPSGGVSAAMGRATLAGAVSVPPSWSAAMPTASSTATALPATGWTVAAHAPEAGGAPGMPGMPMAGAGAGRGYGFAAPRYGFKLTVMGRPVIAG